MATVSAPFPVPATAMISSPSGTRPASQASTTISTQNGSSEDLDTKVGQLLPRFIRAFIHFWTRITDVMGDRHHVQGFALKFLGEQQPGFASSRGHHEMRETLIHQPGDYF